MKVAVVTGAGRGIGAATAQTCAEAGYTVVLAERDDSAGRALERTLREAGREALFVHTDVTNPDSTRACIATTVEHFGRLDLLVNNAGRNARTPLLELNHATWASMLELNLSSITWACQAALPALLETGGCIVNIASLVGLRGQREAVAYAAAKGGVVALTQTMALDFAALGVRVNCICPGDVMTPLYEAWLAAQPDPEGTLREITQRLPVGRLGAPEEIADGVLFLARNGFANGVVLVLDGGKSLG